MSGLEKIIEHIDSSANETANGIINGAREEAARIVSSRKEKTLAQEAVINKQADVDVLAASKRIQSLAELNEKRMILTAKQAQIEKVIEAAAARLKAMDKAQYFDVILRMIPKYAQKGDGEIRFSVEDLARLPEGFQARVSEAAKDFGELKISGEAVRIDGGFILDYGDIEENCSFEALTEAARENLQDKIGQILFS